MDLEAKLEDVTGLKNQMQDLIQMQTVKTQS